MEKTKKEVIPTMELLNEMESLEIYGGIGGDVYGTDDINRNCDGANCGCTPPPPDPEIHPNGVQTCNFYCGAGTTCSE